MEFITKKTFSEYYMLLKICIISYIQIEDMLSLLTICFDNVTVTSGSYLLQGNMECLFV